MELIRHPGVTAGVAVTVAGLIAITPISVSLIDPQEGIGAIIVNPAADAGDLFTALAGNLNSAGAETAAGLSALLNLDLPQGLGQLTAAAFNLVPLIPENILLAGTGVVFEQDFDAYLNFLPAFAANFFPTDWNQVLPGLDSLFQSGLNSLSDALQDLLGGDVANALAQTLLGLNYLFLLVPAVVLIGVPALIGDSLLPLVGL